VRSHWNTLKRRASSSTGKHIPPLLLLLLLLLLVVVLLLLLLLLRGRPPVVWISLVEVPMPALVGLPAPELAPVPVPVPVPVSLVSEMRSKMKTTPLVASCASNDSQHNPRMLHKSEARSEQ
jgi:hypothetical protein